jgi:tetratricopeptide (TPR) repeat protein
MLSLIQYWKYLQTSKSSKLWLCFFLFALSLLSKPAAIILPLVLLALDYWKRRPFTSKVFIEKIPFFILALIFAIVTVKIQSVKAIAGLDLYPLWTRPLFACYSLMIYFVRFFIPQPLSAFHPYPPVDHLGWVVYISPLFVLAIAALLWWQRKNRLLIFGAAFFVINLLLVMQLVSIGQTIVSERYTYVPYIGLAFVLGMLLYRFKNSSVKFVYWALPLLITAIFGYLSFQRTKVWKDSGTLWTDAINHYPTAAMARTNHANYTLNLSMKATTNAEKDSLYASAREDCNIALKENPKHAQGYQNREFINLNQGKYQEAISDATNYIQLDPEANLGYAIRGVAYMRLNQFDKALTDLSKSLSLDPNNEFALNHRGSLYYNNYQKYREALEDFSKAISINPSGNYYMNRSKCYYMLHDFEKAKADAKIALEKKETITEDYRTKLNL